MQSLPQGISSVKYIFMSFLIKKKVITKDSERNIELFVSSQTVKFTPKYPGEIIAGGETPKIYKNKVYTEFDNTKRFIIKEKLRLDEQLFFYFLINVYNMTCKNTLIQIV